MQTARRDELKKQGRTSNQFDDSEYERWSAGIAVSQTPKPHGGIDRFLGTNEKLAARGEDAFVTSIEIGKNKIRKDRIHGLENK
jgi:hypothetical protein